MAVEPRLGVRWAIATLTADATLAALIANGRAYQTLPRAADTQAKPGVTVGVQGTAPPTGAITVGPRTWIEQTVTLRVQAAQQTWSTEQLEAVEARILALLDGRYKQALTGGELIECVYAGTPGDLKESLGDAQIITSTLWFRASLKAT